jgi:hypothetical protein
MVGREERMKRVVVAGLLILVACGGVAAQEPGSHTVVFYPALGRSPMDEGNPDHGTEVRYVVDSVV